MQILCKLFALRKDFPKLRYTKYLYKNIPKISTRFSWNFLPITCIKKRISKETKNFLASANSHVQLLHASIILRLNVDGQNLE